MIHIAYYHNMISTVMLYDIIISNSQCVVSTELTQTNPAPHRALSSSGPGFVKVNGYSGETCAVKDSVDLGGHINSHNSHMSIPSACCSANRELKDCF